LRSHRSGGTEKCDATFQNSFFVRQINIKRLDDKTKKNTFFAVAKCLNEEKN